MGAFTQPWLTATSVAREHPAGLFVLLLAAGLGLAVRAIRC